MKKIFVSSFCLLCVATLFAQNNPTSDTKKKKQSINLGNRANDHLMIQLGYFGWAGIPDSIHTKGLARTFNVYFLFDFPIKTDPHFSVAVGVGVGSDHIYFNKTYVGLKDVTPTLRFINQADTNHFRKTKLATAWLEAPIELRYAFDPANNNKSIKLALGVKVGTLLNAHTRNRDLQNSNGQTVTSYIEKDASKRFFNTNRLVVIGRVGWGHFSLFGTYQVGTLFKNATAADIHPYSIGVTVSGL